MSEGQRYEESMKAPLPEETRRKLEEWLEDSEPLPRCPGCGNWFRHLRSCTANLCQGCGEPKDNGQAHGMSEYGGCV